MPTGSLTHSKEEMSMPGKPTWVTNVIKEAQRVQRPNFLGESHNIHGAGGSGEARTSRPVRR